jgi:hypothetical protein
VTIAVSGEHAAASGIQQLASPKISFAFLEDYLMTRAAVRAKAGPRPPATHNPNRWADMLVPTETDIAARSVL